MNYNTRTTMPQGLLRRLVLSFIEWLDGPDLGKQVLVGAMLIWMIIAMAWSF